MQKYLFYYISVFTIVTAYYYGCSFFNLSGKEFVYPIDDAYIHLAIAEKFALDGSWSINFNSFDSASSSILYTLVLASLIKIFGICVYYPMVINIITGYFTVYWIYRYFADFYTEKEVKLGLFVFIPTTLIYAMVILGMEQTTHMLLSVLAIYFIRKNLRTNFNHKDFYTLLFVLFFLGMVRFESMFFFVALAFVFLLLRKVKEAALVLFFGFLPIVMFGLISIKLGGYFFPNSVLIKASYPAGNIFESFWFIFQKGILFNVSFYKLFLFPFICIGVYIYDYYRHQKLFSFIKKEVVLIVIVLVVLMQSLFGVVKYRYENYLLVMMMMLLVPMSIAYFSNINNVLKAPIFKKLNVKIWIASFGMYLLVGVYLFGYSDSVLKLSSKNIEEQQLEMSRFYNQFYKNQKVVANDIGAIANKGNVELLDIVGLGSTDVADFYIKNKGLETTELEKRAHFFLENYIKENQYKVAVIYPSWFPMGVPSSWIPVASWTINDVKGVAKAEVVWYAFDEKNAQILKINLKNFDLNPNVSEVIF